MYNVILWYTFQTNSCMKLTVVFYIVFGVIVCRSDGITFWAMAIIIIVTVTLSLLQHIIICANCDCHKFNDPCIDWQ